MLETTIGGYKMARKLSLALVATISLISSSLCAVSAGAETHNLSYEEFSATEGFQEMKTAIDSYSAAMLADKNVHLHLTETSGTGVLDLSTTRTEITTSGTKYHYSLYNLNPGLSSKPMIQDYGFEDGTFYGSIETYSGVRQDVTYFKSVMTRLGKPKATLFTTKDISLLTNLGPIPDSNTAIMSASQGMLNWKMFPNLDDPKVGFSLITKTVNPTDPSSTDYSFDFSTPGIYSGDRMSSIHTVATFSGDGKTYKVKTSGMMPYLTLNATINLETTIEIGSSDYKSPNLSSAVSLKTIANMISRIGVEHYLQPKAKAVATKAKLLVGKSHNKLSGAYLVQSAKSLKYAFTPIKGGIKLSSSAHGASGSLCLNVVKNAVQIKPC